MLGDSETSKATACAENVFEIWRKTEESRSTQMIFCDLSTPKNDGSFNIYDDIKNKLIQKTDSRIKHTGSMLIKSVSHKE